MRILFVAPYVPSLIRVRPYHFLRELSRRHEITLVATASQREAEEADGVKAFCRDVHLVPLRLPVAARSCAVGAVRGEPLQAAFCRSDSLESSLRRLLADHRFDVVHVEHLRAGHVGDFLPPSQPTLFDSVDCISLLLERTLRSSHSLRQRVVAALELKRCRAYEARLLRRFDRATVTSPEDQRALLSLEPEARVRVVANGVDLDYFGPVSGPREPSTLVFSGKMSYHANVTAVLYFVQHVLPLVRQTRPEVRLRVAGSNPPPEVRNLARDPAITVTGHLADLRPAVGRAAVALCPVTVKVGIQNKVLESMAMGVPVVSTRAGAEGLAVEAGRDLLVADDAPEFAGHVCRLLADPALRDRVALAGRRYVEQNHRWSTGARKLEGLYLEAIEQRNREVFKLVS